MLVHLRTTGFQFGWENRRITQEDSASDRSYFTISRISKICKVLKPGQLSMVISLETWQPHQKWWPQYFQTELAVCRLELSQSLETYDDTGSVFLFSQRQCTQHFMSHHDPTDWWPCVVSGAVDFTMDHQFPTTITFFGWKRWTSKHRKWKMTTCTNSRLISGWSSLSKDTSPIGHSGSIDLIIANSNCHCHMCPELSQNSHGSSLRMFKGRTEKAENPPMPYISWGKKPYRWDRSIGQVLQFGFSGSEEARRCLARQTWWFHEETHWILLDMEIFLN